MTERSKRLEKILSKKGVKNMFKPFNSLENSDFVLIENKSCIHESGILTTEDYKDILERGATFPPENVHFLVIRNRRNSQTIKNAIASRQSNVFVRYYDYYILWIVCRSIIYF